MADHTVTTAEFADPFAIQAMTEGTRAEAEAVLGAGCRLRGTFNTTYPEDDGSHVIVVKAVWTNDPQG